MTDSLLTAVLAPRGGRRWLASTAPMILLGAAWAATYLAGGSHTALPHLFSVPILLAGVTLGTRGGLIAGLIAAVLSGPMLPLEVATGEAQTTVSWVARGVIFVVIGAATGAGTQAIRRRYEDAIQRSLHDELHPPPPRRRTGLSEPTAAQLRRALEARCFHVVFQPIHRLDDGRLIAMEALARFHGEPYRPPDVWFERAAAAGLGRDLEVAVAERALEVVADVLPPDVSLSINVSPSVLLDERLLTLLEGHADRPVMLEVTEHAIVDDYQELDLALTALRERGAQLAVDDAGAGFSSLRHIVRLAPEAIKLDLSLTQGLGSDPVRAALADCLVGFARRTDTLLIAEGIEQPADLELWRELGADAAQGHLLGRPRPLAAPVPGPRPSGTGQAAAGRRCQDVHSGR